MNPQHACYILGAAPLVGSWPEPLPGDMIIAADAGWKHLLELGWRADAVIGDFDTDAPPPDTLFPEPRVSIIRLPAEKDDTDMAAAIQLGLDSGHSIFYLLGGTGGRLDHTLANIQCLAALAGLGHAAFLTDNGATLTALAGPGTIAFPDGSRGTVSIFAHSDWVGGVTLAGFKYPLKDASLVNTRALGVSNELTGGAASASIGRGTAIVVFPDALRPNLIRNEA
ncbi:MAG: thiamine diphosphokinase [Oscillospiraceae bacterium]|jgi:thiamine pyrophosphokinase|nr:thiamine diphosphokinase [Oscillospiraceae bacterium]